MDWININEELPTTTKSSYGYIYESEPVLVWTENGYEISKFTRRYKAGKNGEMIFERSLWNSNNKVTHWINLPEKP